MDDVTPPRSRSELLNGYPIQIPLDCPAMEAVGIRGRARDHFMEVEGPSTGLPRDVPFGLESSDGDTRERLPVRQGNEVAPIFRKH
jgi:hypothetical protein